MPNIDRNDETASTCSLSFALSTAKETGQRFADVGHSACMANMLPHNMSFRYTMIMTCACSAFAVLSLHHPLAAIELSAWPRVEHQLSLQQPPLAAWPNLPELLKCLNHAHSGKHCTNGKHSDAFTKCILRLSSPCINGEIVPHILCTLLTVHI